MPNEPCGGDTCISPEDLRIMYERIDRAERERDSLRARIEEFRVSISHWLEVEIPGLKLGCEDCDQGHPKTCYACPDLLEALWIADDMYKGIMEERKNPKPGTPEKSVAKHGYAAVKAERDELRAKLAEVEAGAAKTLKALRVLDFHATDCATCQAPASSLCPTCDIREAHEIAKRVLEDPSSAGRSYLDYVHGLEGLLKATSEEITEYPATHSLVCLKRDIDAYLKEGDKDA